MDPEFKNQVLGTLQKTGAFAGSQIFDSKHAEAFNQMPAFEDIKNIVFIAFNAGIKDVDSFIAIFLLIGTFASAFLIRKKRKSDSEKIVMSKN